MEGGSGSFAACPQSGLEGTSRSPAASECFGTRYDLQALQGRRGERKMGEEEDGMSEGGVDNTPTIGLSSLRAFQSVPM